MAEPYPDGPQETQPPDLGLLLAAVHRLLSELLLGGGLTRRERQRVVDVRDVVRRYRHHHAHDDQHGQGDG